MPYLEEPNAMVSTTGRSIFKSLVFIGPTDMANDEQERKLP